MCANYMMGKTLGDLGSCKPDRKEANWATKSLECNWQYALRNPWIQAWVRICTFRMNVLGEQSSILQLKRENYKKYIGTLQNI